MKKFLAHAGVGADADGSRPKFSEFLRAETDKWGKVVKEAKLKLD